MTDSSPSDADFQLSDGKIRFVQFFRPKMQSGTYEVSAEHRISSKDDAIPKGEAFSDRHAFLVRGNRFKLTPADIHSVFPPKQSGGEYANILPHVVLNQHTLPWQRRLIPHDNADADPGVAPDQPSFLAILLFAERDVLRLREAEEWTIPQPEEMTLKDLLPENVPQGTACYPKLSLEKPGEKETDPCKVLDIPVDLFSAVAPTLEDLKLCAHGRIVTDVKDKPSNSLPEGNRLSVVLGGRLPPAGERCIAHVVCLEGMRDLLPDDEGRPSEALEPFDHIRLATLFSWEFGAVDQWITFTGLLMNLNKMGVDGRPLPQRADPLLQMPQAMAQPDDPPVDETIRNAFRMGFTALDHHTRVNDRTISWYRGPLQPSATPIVGMVPAASGDALLRYDPQTGVMDASYATAWQLGRALALGDEPFAVGLYKWRRQNRERRHQSATRNFLETRWPDQVSLSPEETPAEQVIASLLLPHLETVLTGMTPSPLSPSDTDEG